MNNVVKSFRCGEVEVKNEHVTGGTVSVLQNMPVLVFWQS